MIKLEVIEPSKGQPIKTIYFSDEQGWCFRVANFLGEKLVLDELKEFSDSQQIASETLFNSYYEIIAYKNYLKDSSGKIIGAEDFEMIDGQLKKLNSIFFEIINEDNNYMKQKWHNNFGELVYTLETSDKFDFRYVKPNGEVVDYDELYDFLQAYKPREYIEIRNEYLKKIIKEKT
ncbi:hypothetical protein NDN11_10705 [Acinetobacter sp. C26M]|uniref:hypothetical protein n=1 Tax=unclassified Acinetobacter TaxID=196816 RepID=UPI00203700B7|nr:MULTISPECIES: hypothetical protein [unclassified Acinetobacter]USA45199.1 hypothetical protein NDN11_10705 [Acinetobacter sp. C26M]USA48701.1 hypothetical protein NDN12_10705 [Acinetobacter sp. C26G]